MFDLSEMRRLLRGMAKVCDAGVMLLDMAGNLIEGVNAAGEDIAPDGQRLAGIYALARERPVNCDFSRDEGGMLSLSFKDFILVIDGGDRLAEERRFIEQFKATLPFIATTVGGVADICDENGSRIFSCDSDGKVYQRKIPYSKDGHTAMLERRPVIGASNRVKGGIAVRFPISRHYGLGFNNENSVMQKEKLIDRSRHFQFARYTFSDIIGASDVIRSCISLARRISSNLSTVLLFGETGTGKELFAHSIHNESPRCNRPFITVNCGALPGSLADSIFFGYEGGAFTGAKKEGGIGVFEQAQGGTLLLDEISELNLELQTKLLRILQEKELVRIGGKKKIMIDVRIIAASNKALGPLVEKRLFREDLYYRLNVVEIDIPPLRDRKEDIAPLVNSLLFSLNSLMGTNISGITREARDCLESYCWPGNVRELYNYIERALNTVTAETVLDVEHFPQIVRKQYKRLAKADSESAAYTRAKLKFAVTDKEKDLIESTLRRTNNSREKTAAILGVSPATLWRKIKKYGLLRSAAENEREAISEALEQTNHNRAAAAKKLNISTSTLWRKMKKYGG